MDVDYSDDENFEVRKDRFLRDQQHVSRRISAPQFARLIQVAHYVQVRAAPKKAGPKKAAAKKPLQPRPADNGGGNGRSIEETYQKKTPLEHVLLRPDTYVGSVQSHTQPMWVYEGGQLVYREITFVPGLYKIFDEILVNAADNKQRDSTMDQLKVTVDQASNTISVRFQWLQSAGQCCGHSADKIYYAPHFSGLEQWPWYPCGDSRGREMLCARTYFWPFID